jgi:outer membrane protein
MKTLPDFCQQRLVATRSGAHAAHLRKRGQMSLSVALAAVASLGAPAIGMAQAGAAETPPPTVRTTTSAPALSLTDALREGDQYGFANRIAIANADADEARARLPLKGILPTARVESGVVRTTDPIGAFGTTLRQRVVTAAAFDPARLNDPAAISNVQGGLVLEIPLFNADAYGALRSTRAAARASSAIADWTTITVRVNVVGGQQRAGPDPPQVSIEVRAYYGAVLATEKVSMLVQARGAADAAVHQVQLMMQQGLVTRADVLQADVRATDVASQLIGARNDARSAKQQLAVLLGRTDGTLPVLPTALPADEAIRTLAALDTSAAAPSGTIATRADVRAAREAVAAAEGDRTRATAMLLPRVNSFARYDWNAPNGLFAGHKNWTVGVMASWALSSGGSELADIAGAKARAVSARASEQAVIAQVAADADATRRGVVVALERLDLAERAAMQSLEAHRLVDKRYGAGLATIAELLGAESSATGAALAGSAARYALIDAIATHRRAIGANPADLSTLETAR